ncbi:MAG: MetS family NSS transporter small subunit [Bacteroidota bacterium]
MSTLSIISMVLILTIVVGGFVYFLMKAIKYEKSKAEEARLPDGQET